MARFPTLSILACSLLGMQVPTFAQTLTYAWLNQPCEENLNCSNGCSACNQPAEESPTIIGTGVQWTGIDVCPHPISTGDNAVYTEGWPIEADPMAFVSVGAIALVPLQVDSIILRHRRSADGPQRLRVEFTNNLAHVADVIGEVDVTQEYQESAFTDLGCLYNEGASYAGLQIRMTALQGGAGNWQLDEMRIVTSPCSTAQVGLTENFQRDLKESTAYNDVLGRPVKGELAPGVYVGSRKRVQIF